MLALDLGKETGEALQSKTDSSQPALNVLPAGKMK